MKHLLLTTVAAVLLVGTAFADPIHDAAEDGDLAGVQAELDKGVDVNAKTDYGMTPLHFAAYSGHKEIAELLIAEGADVNAKEEGGGTPLLYAAIRGHKEIAELLIDKGADVNAKDKYGFTPLYQTARFGHKEVAELLIAKGADVNAKMLDGRTPLDWAVFFRNKFRTQETIDLLRKHGGKTGKELEALMPRLVQHGRFAFSFVAKKGKVYEVQDSFDLLNWEVIKTYNGTGISVRFDEERDHDPPKWFYRVSVVE